MGRVLLWVGLLSQWTGCKSLVVYEVTFIVPEALAADYHRGAPGLLQSTEGGDIAAICGLPVEVALSSRGSGCRPEEHEISIDAWIVPVPDSWDTALCYENFVPGAEIDDGRYPREDLPEPTPLDPGVSVDAKWTWTPFCGGKLEAEVVIDG